MTIVCPSSPTAATAIPSILIVDDQTVVRAAVRLALEKLETPFPIEEACDGAEALAKMQAKHFDIIFSDIQMPGLSGPEALAHAYSTEDKRPFMVLMSTQNGAIAREISKRVGIYEFIHKPFQPSAVINAIYAYERLNRVSSVLVVDDSATVRRLISRLLEKSLFKVELVEACSGTEAVALAASRSFDLVICDFNMPGLDGVETAGRIIETNPKAQIVVISTEQPAGLVRSVQFAGAFAFLRKPFGAADLDALMHDAFALKRPTIAAPTHAILSNARDQAPVAPANANAGNFGAEGVA